MSSSRPPSSISTFQEPDPSARRILPFRSSSASLQSRSRRPHQRSSFKPLRQTSSSSNIGLGEDFEDGDASPEPDSDPSIQFRTQHPMSSMQRAPARPIFTSTSMAKSSQQNYDREESLFGGDTTLNMSSGSERTVTPVRQGNDHHMKIPVPLLQDEPVHWGKQEEEKVYSDDSVIELGYNGEVHQYLQQDESDGDFEEDENENENENQVENENAITVKSEQAYQEGFFNEDIFDGEDDGYTDDLSADSYVDHGDRPEVYQDEQQFGSSPPPEQQKGLWSDSVFSTSKDKLALPSTAPAVQRLGAMSPPQKTEPRWSSQMLPPARQLSEAQQSKAIPNEEVPIQNRHFKVPTSRVQRLRVPGAPQSKQPIQSEFRQGSSSEPDTVPEKVPKATNIFAPTQKELDFRPAPAQTRKKSPEQKEQQKSRPESVVPEPAIKSLFSPEKLRSIKSMPELLSELASLHKSTRTPTLSQESMAQELVSLSKYAYPANDGAKARSFFEKLDDESYKDAGTFIRGKKRQLEDALVATAEKRRKIAEDMKKEVTSVAEVRCEKLAKTVERHEALKGGVGEMLKKAGFSF